MPPDCDPLLLVLWTYWLGLRSGRAMPRFDALDLAGLGSAADRMLVVQREGGRFRYVSVGRSIQKIYGYPMEGLTLTAALPPNRRDQAIHRYALVCDSGRPLLARNAYQVSNRFGFRVDRLIVPLAAGDGTVWGALCAQVMGPARAAPSVEESTEDDPLGTLTFLDVDEPIVQAV